MRDNEMARGRWARVLTAVAVAGAGVLLAMASPAAIARPAQARPAAAGPNTDPVESWKLGRFDHGDGFVLVSSEARDHERPLFVVQDQVARIRPTARVTDAIRLPVDVPVKKRRVSVATPDPGHPSLGNSRDHNWGIPVIVDSKSGDAVGEQHAGREVQQDSVLSRVHR
jgi:hypothetical protein